MPFVCKCGMNLIMLHPSALPPPPLTGYCALTERWLRASMRMSAGAHTDWGMLTVLATDSVPGLQIYHAGAWRDVPPRPGCFVVNVGGTYPFKCSDVE